MPSAGPEARYEAKEAIALAFVTACSILLPPRQAGRAVLRDLLWVPSMPVRTCWTAAGHSVNQWRCSGPDHHVRPGSRAGTGAAAAALSARERTSRRGSRPLPRATTIDGRWVGCCRTTAWFHHAAPSRWSSMAPEAIAVFLRDIWAGRSPHYRLIPTRAETALRLPAATCRIRSVGFPLATG